jgi:hypothetical protein
MWVTSIHLDTESSIFNNDATSIETLNLVKNLLSDHSEEGIMMPPYIPSYVVAGLETMVKRRWENWEICQEYVNIVSTRYPNLQIDIEEIN